MATVLPWPNVTSESYSYEQNTGNRRHGAGETMSWKERRTTHLTDAVHSKADTKLFRLESFQEERIVSARRRYPQAMEKYTGINW